MPSRRSAEQHQPEYLLVLACAYGRVDDSAVAHGVDDSRSEVLAKIELDRGERGEWLRECSSGPAHDVFLLFDLETHPGGGSCAIPRARPQGRATIGVARTPPPVVESSRYAATATGSSSGWPACSSPVSPPVRLRRTASISARSRCVCTL